MKKLYLFLNMFICLVVPVSAQPYFYTPTGADKNNHTERIIDLHADIRIHSDGNVIVTEYFTVYAAGVNIRRGITRDIPEYRIDRNNKTRSIPVEILSVKHNGEISEYHTETSRKSGNSEIIVYTGSSDAFLEKGIHQYEFVYQARGHVGFYDDFDELYWNVMGEGCIYTIEHISATLYPPDNSEAIQWSCYTGVKGSTEQACNCNEDKSAPTFTVTRTLQPKEGFTIAVSFPRDIVQRPTASQEYWMKNKNTIYSWAVILIILLFQIISWYIKGRDAKKRVVIPQFSPPENWSAAMVSYLFKCKFEGKAFTSGILQMAVKGAIAIECRLSERNKKQYFLVPKSRSQLTEIEKLMYEKLFITEENGKEIVKERKLSSANASYLSESMRVLESDTTSEVPLDSVYQKNHTYRLLSLVISISIWIVYMFLFDYDNDNFTPFMLVSLTLIISHQIYRHSIGRRTEYGAKVEAELAGLRMYLGTAEKQWHEQLMPPEQTPEHFEEMLPYAFALGVENQWCKKFHNVLKQYNYTPQWCTTDDFSPELMAGFLATTVYVALNKSALLQKTYSVASSSSSSGSSSWSSGSDGGGSSGGGGGGGGVGGW